MTVIVSHWSANAVVLAACVAVAAVYLIGLRAIAKAAHSGAGSRDEVVKQAAAFGFGLLAVLLALVSPVGYWAQRFIWIRSLQDLLLAVVAPALIVLGAPWLMLASGAGRRPAGRAGGQADARRSGAAARHPNRTWLVWPVAVTAAFNAGWWAWHLPAPYDAALHHPAVYGAEVVMYLGLGMAFWLQLIGSRPFTPRLTPLLRVALVAATLVSISVLGMVLVFGAGLLYPSYLGPEHHVLGVVADQQVGGAVLWVVALPPFAVALVALLIQWLNEEESQALAVGLDRLLEPPASAWPSRPRLR